MPRTKPAMNRPRERLSSIAIFFGDAERVVEERQRAAEDGDLGPLDAARERARQHARRRHQAIGGLVMLVEADAVEAELVGVFELVEIAV